MNARSILSWAAVFLFATGVFGWHSVPLVAAVCGWFGWKDSPVLTAAIAAAASWLVLLVIQGFRGPVAELVGTLGGVMGVPGAVIYLLALVFPALLAGAAAGLTGAMREGLFGTAANCRADMGALSPP